MKTLIWEDPYWTNPLEEKIQEMVSKGYRIENVIVLEYESVARENYIIQQASKALIFYNNNEKY